MPRYFVYCDYYQLLQFKERTTFGFIKLIPTKYSLFKLAESKEKEIIILFKDLL